MPKKGYKQTEEHKTNNGKAHLGQKSWNKGTNLSGMKDKTHSEETKKKMSLSAMGRKMSDETKLKLSETKTGITQSYESRKKKSIKIQGIKEEDWVDFQYSENERRRHSKEWKLWRIKVFERDNYTCIDCNQYGGILHPHHIKPLVNYPELAFDISNGNTMCKSCHMILHGLERRKKR